MVAQVVAVHHPSGEPAAVEPSRIALSVRGNKDADGLPSESLFAAARNILFGPIPVGTQVTVRAEAS
jgi:hypothetical protein